MSPLPMIFFTIALGFIASSLFMQTSQRELSIESDAMMTSITQIARAQHLYYSQNPALGYAAARGNNIPTPPPPLGTYPERMIDDILSPLPPGTFLLPAGTWNPDLPQSQRYATKGHDDTPLSPGFEVTYNGIIEYTGWTGHAPLAGAITRAATRFGPIACTADFTPAIPVCSATIVQGLIVNFARAIDMTLVDEFLPLNAERPMFGNLTINNIHGSPGVAKSQLTTGGSLNLFNDNDPNTPAETHLTADGNLNLGFAWNDSNSNDVFDYNTERNTVPGAGGFYFKGGPAPENYMVVAGIERIKADGTQTEYISTTLPNIKIHYQDGRIEDVRTMNRIHDINMTNTGTINANDIDAVEGVFSSLRINP